MRKIATEEAWSIPEVAAALGAVARSPSASLDKLLVAAIYDTAANGTGYGALNFMQPAVQFMDSAPLTERERHKLYHENAERIFHIAPV